jgi:hypothetical protein
MNSLPESCLEKWVAPCDCVVHIKIGMVLRKNCPSFHSHAKQSLFCCYHEEVMFTKYEILLVGIPSVPYGLPSWQEVGAPPGFLHLSAEL